MNKLVLQATSDARQDARVTGPPWGGMLGTVGMLFLVAGGVDLLLAWIPMRLGNPEWEFGTISASLDGLPLPSMGLVFLTVSGMVTGRRWLVVVGAVGMAVLAVVVASWGVLYALDIPVALGSVGDETGALREGLQKAVVKAVIQAVVYPVGFALLTWQALRATGSRIGES